MASMRQLEGLPYDPENPPWIKSYDPWVPPRVEVPDELLHEMLANTATKYPDAPAVTYYGETITYRRLYNETLRVAQGLAEQGVRQGDCIALVMANTPHYITTAYGAMLLGARACLFNPLWSAFQIEENARKLGAKLIVINDVVQARVGLDPEKYNLILANIDDYGGPRWKLMIKTARILGKLPKIQHRDKHLHYKQLLENPPIQEAYRGDPKKTVAAMLFTGGTTGVPKAVMLSHKNIRANILYQRIWFNRKEAHDRVLGLLPFFHAYGFGSILGLSINIAANLILMIRFDPHKLVDTIINHKINLVPAAPTIYLSLLRTVPEKKLRRIRGVSEICFSGAAPLPVEVIRRWEETTGCRIVEGYGLTETSPVAAANPIKSKRKHGSIGLPMPNTLLSTADPIEPVMVDGTGEIVISGEQVMLGYYGLEEENKKAFFECCGRRWLRTGDIGYMDEDGYFFIVDRKKDVIKYKGHSIYPRPIEETLYEHPCVAEAAVIGVPDPEAGENIKAFIALKPECRGKITPEELKEWAKQRLGLLEYPRIIEFRDELPKSLAGKILRRVLREEELKKRQ